MVGRLHHADVVALENSQLSIPETLDLDRTRRVYTSPFTLPTGPYEGSTSTLRKMVMTLDLRKFMANLDKIKAVGAEARARKAFTLPTSSLHREFIIRVQLSHEHHYDDIHKLMEDSNLSRTVITQDGIKRDLPNAMFYFRSPARDTTSQQVLQAVTTILADHAKQHPLKNLNPQIMVMDAKDLYLTLDKSRQP
jgi:hypothetical protein